MSLRAASPLPNRPALGRSWAARLTALCLAATAGCSTTRLPEPATETLVREVALMGTLARVEVVALDRPTALQLSEAVVLTLEAAERRLTTWDADGELAQVNAGTASASPQLARELADAEVWSARTQGAFDPRCAALVAAWDLRGEGRRPSPAELDAARDDRAQWDEGGFGKGAALREVQALLQDAPGLRRATIDLGGQWLLVGDAPFELTLADPAARDRGLAVFDAPAGSVATSGQSERGIVLDGQWLGHVLDPRSGQPASAFGSITVIHPDPLAADCLATAFLVLGPEAALEHARHDPQLEVVVVETGADGARWRASAGIAPRNLSPR